MKRVLITAFAMVFLWVASAQLQAATVTIVKQDVYGSQRVVHGYITILSESYSSGGFYIPPQSYGLSQVTSMSFGQVDVGAFWPVLSGGYIKLNRTNPAGITQPAQAPTAASPHRFNVIHVSAMTDSIMLVTRMPSNVGAALGVRFGAFAPTSAATADGRIFTAADGETHVMVPYDTASTHPKICLRAKMVNADTLWFSDTTNLLYHRGLAIGEEPVYVPYGQGELLTISWHPNPARAVSPAAVPLRFSPVASVARRLRAVNPGAANSWFGASTASAGITSYRGDLVSEVRTGTTVSCTIYFTAIGY